MKNILLLSIALSMGLWAYGQHQRPYVPKSLQDYSLPDRLTATDFDEVAVKPSNPTVKSGAAPTETTIGETRYDLQTNSSVQNRFYRYADGTMGASWTFGLLDPGFADRGSAYNYFDGTSWGPYPSSRIETMKTGWPSYAPLGANGEMIVSHIGTNVGLAINTRGNKGTGAWVESTFAGPVGAEKLLWPRAITNGSNHNNIHLMALTAPTGNAGTIYNGMNGALVYSRSTDGGATWGIFNVQPTGVTSTEYLGLNGDGYAWAEPKGDTLAFVVGNNWYDIFLLKSTDNGTTWTKTMIWTHPYPLFDRGNLVPTDTFYCPDGSIAAAIDSEGKVHVVFGIQRAHSDGAGTFWFPYVDGIAYWTEDKPEFTSANFKYTLHPDSLFNGDNLIAWFQDVNQNDTMDLLGGTDAIGKYYVSLSSFPTLTIDENDNIFLVYSSVTEGRDNGLQNYRHLWARASLDNGSSWGDFVDITASIIHNFDECVFPCLAARSDNAIHLIYQADEEPGLHARGDEDAPTDNNVIYSAVPKTDLGVGIPKLDRSIAYVGQNFPNPATTTTRVVLNLSRPCLLSLEVTNLMGQRLNYQSRGYVSNGHHIFDLDVSQLSPGIYFYTIRAGNQSVTKKMIVK